jgi:hypothetical protein
LHLIVEDVALPSSRIIRRSLVCALLTLVAIMNVWLSPDFLVAISGHPYLPPSAHASTCMP